MDTAIQKAQEKMIFVTNDKEELRAYQMRMLAISDQVSGLNYATRKGEERGIKIGEKRGEKRGEKKRDMEHVKRLTAKGKSIEEISDILDISVTQIQKILQAN